MTIYYDKRTMKITQTQSDDTIPVTDELMADYRYYSANLQDKSLELVQEVGKIPYLVKYKLDEDGNRYSHYTDEVDEDGYKLPDMAKIAEMQVNQARADIVKAVEEYIQATIDGYNEANGILLKNIDSCFKYTAVPTYTHYQFCVDVIAWNARVWETARAIEAEVLAGNRGVPSVEELLGELPKFGE